MTLYKKMDTVIHGIQMMAIDMDGTLYRFHDHIVDESGHVQIEKMYEPDFFIKLDPFENMKDAINLLYSVDKEEVEIFVLSSADIKEVV